MVSASYLVTYRSESYRHFMAKASLFYRLKELGHEVITEMKLPGISIDICDRTTMTFYEIEFSVSPKFRSRKIEQYKVPSFELIIVDCSKMPDDIDGIRRFLEGFIIPD